MKIKILVDYENKKDVSVYEAELDGDIDLKKYLMYDFWIKDATKITLYKI